MKYSPELDAMIISAEKIKRAGLFLLSAIAEIRKAYDLPLDKYERESGGLTPSDHAQKNIIDIAECLGIELGAKWGNEIDVRKYG